MSKTIEVCLFAEAALSDLDPDAISNCDFMDDSCCCDGCVFHFLQEVDEDGKNE